MTEDTEISDKCYVGSRPGTLGYQNCVLEGAHTFHKSQDGKGWSTEAIEIDDTTSRIGFHGDGSSTYEQFLTGDVLVTRYNFDNADLLAVGLTRAPRFDGLAFEFDGEQYLVSDFMLSERFGYSDEFGVEGLAWIDGIAYRAVLLVETTVESAVTMMPAAVARNIVVADQRDARSDAAEMTDDEIIAHVRNTVSLPGEMAPGAMAIDEDDDSVEALAYKTILLTDPRVAVEAPKSAIELIPVSTDGGESVFQSAFIGLNRWNGFAVPYFLHGDALKIAEWANDGNVPTFIYDDARGVFLELDEGSEADDPYFPCDTMLLDGKVAHNIGVGWMWEEYEAEPTAEDVANAIARAKREILHDVNLAVSSSGQTMPSTVASFSELHDYVDANEYGGLTDGMAWLDSEHAADDVQNVLDAWIKSGALRG